MNTYPLSTSISGDLVLAVYPDQAVRGKDFFIVVTADSTPTGGGTSVLTFQTAPLGWVFAGCSFVSGNVSMVGSPVTIKSQSVRLRMDADVCSWDVLVTFGGGVGGATPVSTTFVAGTTSADPWGPRVAFLDEVETAELVFWAFLLLFALWRSLVLVAVFASVGVLGVLVPGWPIGFPGELLLAGSALWLEALARGLIQKAFSRVWHKDGDRPEAGRGGGDA